VSWEFDAKHAAIIYDAQGREWRLEIKPDSFLTYRWVAKPVRHVGSITMYSGAMAWEDAATAQIGARLTLTELGFRQRVDGEAQQ
jgi:hypothetical protein